MSTTSAHHAPAQQHRRGATAAAAIEVRPAGPADAEQIAVTLAGAFLGDPVFGWIMPEEQTRRRHLPALFRIIADGVLPHDATSRTRDDRGAALWVPANRESLDQQAQADLAEAIGALEESAVQRWAALSTELAQRHPAQPYDYLWFLGVRVAAQGSGLGSALLSHRLPALDDSGRPAFLHATSPRSRALYERHGFVVTEELTAAGSPPLWGMWRAPGGQQEEQG